MERSLSNCCGWRDQMQVPSPPATEEDGRTFDITYPPPMSSPRHNSPPPTKLFSLERITTLLVSVLVALCSGTNYVCPLGWMTPPRLKELNIAFLFPGLLRYDPSRPLCTSDRTPSSAYGPQLGVRLGLSHTQQNLVGLGGNGPFIPLPPTL